MNNGFLMLSKLSVILLLPVFQNKYYCLHWSFFIYGRLTINYGLRDSFL